MFRSSPSADRGGPPTATAGSTSTAPPAPTWPPATSSTRDTTASASWAGPPGRASATTGEGKRAALDLLSRRRPPTALVCASDLLALGAREVGAAAVIGFDDTAMAHATGLSSVRQPVDEVAAACIRILVEDLERRRTGGPPTGATDRHQHVLLTPDLVIRDSG
jgi:DNA-binding LacI/PurR family transcriptional regulator